VPKNLQRQAENNMHRLDHAGVLGTYKMVQRDHWFRGMEKLVKYVVRHCNECTAVKRETCNKGGNGT